MKRLKIRIKETRRLSQTVIQRVLRMLGWDGRQRIDPKTVGLTDAVNSGFYLSQGRLVENMVVTAEDVVVDVGCGGGLASHYCARQGAHIVFTDVEQSKIDSLKAILSSLPARKLEGLVSDTCPLPLPDEYASKVLAMEVLEHTRDPNKILKELYRVGKPGAQYLITVPDSRSEKVQAELVPKGYFDEPNHIQRFDKASFIKLVEAAGFEVEQHMTWGFYWTMWWCLKWLDEGGKAIQGEVLELVEPPYTESTLAWANLWNRLQNSSEARPLIRALNEVLPKSQGVIARKPAH